MKLSEILSKPIKLKGKGIVNLKGLSKVIVDEKLDVVDNTFYPYFCIEALDNTVDIYLRNSSSIYYSKDCKNWLNIPTNPNKITIKRNEIIYIKRVLNSNYSCDLLTSIGKVKVYGHTSYLSNERNYTSFLYLKIFDATNLIIDNVVQFNSVIEKLPPIQSKYIPTSVGAFANSHIKKIELTINDDKVDDYIGKLFENSDLEEAVVNVVKQQFNLTQLFYNCKKLNKITLILPYTVNASSGGCCCGSSVSYFNEWTYGVGIGHTGTFILSSNNKVPDNIPYGINGVPIGWTVKTYEV